MTIGLDIFYHAFLELGSCRSIGMAEGPIPWLAIQRFCEVNGIDGDLRDDLFYHIHQLDQEYLRWRSKQIAQKSKGSPSGGKRSKGVR